MNFFRMKDEAILQDYSFRNLYVDDDTLVDSDEELDAWREVITPSLENILTIKDLKNDQSNSVR